MKNILSTSPASAFSPHFENVNRAFLQQKPSARLEQAPQQVVFLLLDHFSMSTFSVALDACVTANLIYSRKLYQMQTCGIDQPRALSDLGIAIPTDGVLDDLELDANSVLVVCGGYRNELGPLPKLTTKLHEAAQRGATLCGIWNGSYYLSAAGTVDDIPVAIHQDNRALMRECFPEQELSYAAYSAGPGRYTCAGPNSVLDMMLDMISDQQGGACAQSIEEVIGRDRTSAEGECSSSLMLSDPQAPQALKDSILLMEKNIDEPLPVNEIAELVGISRRQIERLFNRHVGSSPARYYLECRLTQARQLLLQSNLSITDVSVACGFVSSTHFSRSYRRLFGHPPTDVRRGRD